MKKNNFKSLMQAAVLVCTPLVIASCDDVFGDVDNPIPSHLTVSQAAVNLVLHADSPDSTFIRKGIAATGAEIVYSSSNEKIATVDAAGKITAVNGGKCWIRVKATGMDSHGKMTYQEATDSFLVNVQDWRAQIKFAEEGTTVNSALIEKNVFKFKQSEVYPKTASVTYQADPVAGAAPATNPVAGIDATTGKITLKAGIRDGVSVITATMTDPNDDRYEMKSFGNGTKVEAKYILTIKEGVAYISGYDAEGEPETTYIYKDYDGQSYTKLSDVLTPATTPAPTADVALAAGTYYLDQSINFNHNIRIKGDVKIILGRGKNLYLNDGTNDLSFLDESGSKAYKLNILTEPDDEDDNTAAVPAGTLSALRIKDFKEVNLSGGAWVYATVDAVENVTINRGTMPYGLTGTGNVNVTEGFAAHWGYKIKGFATVTLAKAKSLGGAQVGDLEAVTSAIIGENTRAGSIKGVTTLTINKKATVGNIGAAGAANKVTNLTISEASSIGDLVNIGSATITKTPIQGLQDITELTLNDVDATATTQLLRVGTATINKIANAGGITEIHANTLNIIDGTIANVKKVVGFKAKTGGGYEAQAAALTISGGSLTVNYNTAPATGENYAIFGDVTMTGGALSVTGPTGGDYYAVRGNVNVAGSLATDKFHAESVYHAVSGTITGTFEGSNGGATPTWTAVSGTDKPKWLRNKKAE